MNKKLLFFVIAPLFSLVLVGVQLTYRLYNNSYQGEAKEFVIFEGDRFGKINHRLKKEKLISSSTLFHRYSQIKKVMTQFKPGTYEIKKGMTIPDIIELFISGKTKQIKVTIPEGKNLYEIAEILEEKNITPKSQFIQLAKNQNIAKELKIDFNRLEGFLYPDTYFFGKNSSAISIIKKMVQTFRAKVNELDFSNSKLNFNQVIILASMVEKETGAPWERPRIAGVFLNRLQKKMRLQSDPTTIYGVYETYNGNLKRKHLMEKNPYNTYKISGLPAGPIANPGLESIKAVLFPETHDYLYFVSLNDGTHKFTSTYKEHSKYVNKYQKTRSARTGKSWRDLKKKNNSN